MFKLCHWFCKKPQQRFEAQKRELDSALILRSYTHETDHRSSIRWRKEVLLKNLPESLALNLEFKLVHFQSCRLSQCLEKVFGKLNMSLGDQLLDYPHCDEIMSRHVRSGSRQNWDIKLHSQYNDE